MLTLQDLAANISAASEAILQIHRFNYSCFTQTTIPFDLAFGKFQVVLGSRFSI